MNIENEIKEVRQQLTSSKIYEEIKTIEELRIFMSAHVFAVWDFMSLVKRLQNSMTCTSLPWQTPLNPKAARLINEIVFYEESDLDHLGSPASHLDMYLAAMDDIGADSSMFNTFINALKDNHSLDKAFKTAKVPEYIASFVKNNIKCAAQGQIEEVASSFLYGREGAIPDMFILFLEKWQIDKAEIPALVYYLERHIGLDSDEHGPAAEKILMQLIGDDELKASNATAAAIAAIKDRVRLWDGVIDDINIYRNQISVQKLVNIELR